MKKWKKALSAVIAATVMSVCAGATVGCGSCNSCGGHKHTFDTEWSFDESEHWHDATCKHDGEKSDIGPHEDENMDGDCDVCGVEMNKQSGGGNQGGNGGNQGGQTPPAETHLFEARADKYTSGTKLEAYKDGARYGLYSEYATDTDYFIATSNGFVQRLGTVGNKGIYISLGLLKGDIEGGFEVSSDKMGSKWDLIQLRSGGKTIFAVRTDDDGKKFIKKFDDKTEDVNFPVEPKAEIIYKVSFKLTAGDDGNYKLTLKMSDETFVEDFELGVKAVDSIYLTSSNAGSKVENARLLTIDKVFIDGEVMTLEDYRQRAREEIDSAYIRMVGKDAEGTEGSDDYVPAVAGTHMRNSAAIKAAYDAINLSSISEIEELRETIADFRALATDVDSDEKIEAAIDEYDLKIAAIKTGKAGDYIINKSAFDVLIAEYEVADFSAATSVATVTNRYAEFAGRLAQINDDEAEIAAYAATRHADINGYGVSDLEDLDDADLEEVIAQIKATAIATLTDGIIGTDGYAIDEYYKTLIDNKVTAAQQAVRAKIEDASKPIGEVREAALEEYAEYVRIALDEIRDSAFKAELTSSAPTLDVSVCQKAGAVAKALAAAKEEFDTWLKGEIASKEYSITVQGTLKGASSGSAVTIKVKYGEALSLDMLPDPMASNNKFMIDPDDGNYYIGSVSGSKFGGADAVYSDYNLFVKIVHAAVIKEVKNTLDYTPLADEYGFSDDGASKNGGDQTAMPAGVMKGAGNGFLTITDSTDGTAVTWRDSSKKFIENKGDGLTVTFAAGGKLIIKTASTGSNNTSRFGIKDAQGNWLVPTKITGKTSKVTAADPTKAGSAAEIGSYEFTSTSEVTFEFTITKAGVYTISCPSLVTGRGARMLLIQQTIDAHKVKATAASSVTLQETATLGLGQDVRLKLTAEPATAGYTEEWSSDDTTVATVDQNGLVTAADTAKIGDTVTIRVKVTDVDGKEFNGQCTVTVTEAKKMVLVYLTDAAKISAQIYNNGWIDDSTIVSSCSAFFKNLYSGLAYDGIKYDNGTEDTSDDIALKIGKAESDTYVKFTLARDAKVTVYYTYKEADKSTNGFKVDGESEDWPAVSVAGKVVAKNLGILTAGEHSLTRAGEIAFCYMIVEVV